MSNVITAWASAARTDSGSPYSSDIASDESAAYKGVYLVLDVTAASGTSPTLDVKVQRFDSVSGKYVDLAGGAFAQQTTTGTNALTIYPGIAETANVSVSDHVTDKFRAVATIGGTTPSFTFSLGGFWLV